MMKTFKSHLNKKLTDKKINRLFKEEKRLIELALKIHEIRENSGLTQDEVAKKAHITQQQLSKIENGINCNIITLLKVCNVLNIDLYLKNKREKIVS